MNINRADQSAVREAVLTLLNISYSYDADDKLQHVCNTAADYLCERFNLPFMRREKSDSKGGN